MGYLAPNGPTNPTGGTGPAAYIEPVAVAFGAAVVAGARRNPTLLREASKMISSTARVIQNSSPVWGRGASPIDSGRWSTGSRASSGEFSPSPLDLQRVPSLRTDRVSLL
ncbi:MAG: hypothetical protein S4CHLAM102_12690 [Chlamydiia bacterium]|nr:hypothetical protein [Chlamydiia bacterium]